MAYLQLRGIEKSFGEARVIKGVNLEIQGIRKKLWV